ncbi:hypothetical protein Ahy_B06g085117 [Arachis hypogaea]|uniref:Ubiquitin-like protease family profile domain-containing protein n=1 Tax=Arachis hypogaea TaxID=3818 RepID=A0A444YTJ2_ARAHY|nr:hypothetical protein Ahy_B06g085117 [Arachis hypogaea]
MLIDIVSAMCLILNQQKIKRFQEEVYCLPPDIVNMAIANHPEGVFLQPKTNKSFRIFAPVCHSQNWWLWLANTRKWKFYILDPYHTTSPSDERMALNKFILGVFLFNIRCKFVLLWVYLFIKFIHSICWGAPLKRKDKDKEIEPPYINISGQKTRYKSFNLKIKLSYIYDCAIYVMKWLEIIQPENIKRLKYEWDNWT